MKLTMMIGPYLLAFFLQSSSGLASELIFKKDDGEVKFKAIGNPSALVIEGEGSGAEGVLNIGAEAPKGELVFDLSTLKTGIGLRDRHMRNKYLEVEKFPQAKFTPTKLPWTETGTKLEVQQAPFEGRLELHGVERPIQGLVTVKEEGENNPSISFTFTIKLTDFKIDIPSFAEITVAENVDVTVLAEPSLK